MGAGSSLSKNVSIVVLFIAALVGLIFTIIDMRSDEIKADAIAKPLQTIVKQTKEAWTVLTKDKAALETRSPSGGSAEVLDLITERIAKLAQEKKRLKGEEKAFRKRMKAIIRPQSKDPMTLKELIEAASASLQSMREKAASDIEAVRDSMSALDIEVSRAYTQLKSFDDKLQSLDVRKAEEKTLEEQNRVRDIGYDEFKRKEAERRRAVERMTALKKDAGKMGERLCLFSKIGVLATNRYQARKKYDKEYEGLKQKFLIECPAIAALVDGVDAVSLDLENEIRRKAIFAVNPDAFALSSDPATVESVEKAIAELTAKKGTAQKAVNDKRAEEESNTETKPRMKFDEFLRNSKQLRDTYNAGILKAEEEVKVLADSIEAEATEGVGRKLLYLRYEKTQDGTGFFAVSEVKLSIAALFAADHEQLDLMTNSSKHFYTKDTLIKVLTDPKSEILYPGYDPSELEIQASEYSSSSRFAEKIDFAFKARHDLIVAAYGARCLVFSLDLPIVTIFGGYNRNVSRYLPINVFDSIGYINCEWAIWLIKTLSE